jgi:hypothetical protein
MSELKVDKVSPRSGTYLAVATLSYKNIIINGDMSIAQRSTSVASITTSGYYTVDRWNFVNSNLGTFTMSQDTDVPTGQGFAKSTKLDCTTADASPSVSDFSFFRQKFEGQNLQYLKKGTANAESLTLSFWVKSNKTGTYIAELVDNDNTRQISKSYTIDNASTWEKKTITFVGDTTGTLANDNDASFVASFWLGAGTDFTSGTLQTSWSSIVNANRAVGQVNLADDTANEWYITGVQLEAGTTASDFEFLPVDVNLDRCLRYYELVASGLDKYFVNAHYYNTTYIRTVYTYRKIMRATASLDIVSGTNYYRIVRNNSSDTFDDLTLTAGTEKAGLLINTTDVSGTGGQAGDIRTANASAYIAFDAEL